MISRLVASSSIISILFDEGFDLTLFMILLGSGNKCGICIPIAFSMTEGSVSVQVVPLLFMIWWIFFSSPPITDKSYFARRVFGEVKNDQ